MIQRTFSADFINSVVNHPAVRDGVEAKGVLDFTDAAANLNNFVLVNEHGGFLVIKLMPGIYECHTQFLPEGRGQAAIEAVEEALRYMFIETDCVRIVTKVNVNNKAVRMFAGRFFRKRGQSGDHCYYSLDLDDWISTDGHCLVKGRLFQAQIEEYAVDDPNYVNFTGAALLMALSNNVYKGQLAFNRWAAMAGFEPIILLSETPLMIRKGKHTVLIQNNEVTLCPLH